jgi:predicted dehydrogenase
MLNSQINIGIVGACGRGASFKHACDDLPQVRIHAVCDTNEDDLPTTKLLLGAEEHYTLFDEMIAKSDLDAVIIGTPMPFHVPQAQAALEKGIHVLSEVPAGISIEECKTLTHQCHASNGIYMMAENYTYLRQNVIIRALVEAGLFGTPYYAEGEYIHEVKALNEQTPWRRKWQTGIDGITYGTHSLGPILQWMPGDRVESVCSAGSGHHYRDPSGNEYENQDTCIMLCKMRSGGLVKIRVDMLSDRPHAMTNYQLQGTDGAYESARTSGEVDRIWLRNRSETNQWMALDDLADEFLPDHWKLHEQEAEKVGHGGGDYYEILDFVAAIEGKHVSPIGIHEAMDMTLPGLCSQESIRQNGRWIEVPDSREWIQSTDPHNPSGGKN